MLLAPLPDCLPRLSGDARVWLFAAPRALGPEEQRALQSRMDAFAAAWTSHGRAVPASATVLEDRVLAVAAHLSDAEVNAGVSGCGIDKLTHTAEAAADALGITWTGPLDVSFRDSDGWQTVSRLAFKQLVRSGVVDGATAVLDLSTDRLQGLRAHGVVRPAAESWHGAAFGLAPAAASAG